MTKDELQDIASRAGWTAAQAFLSTFVLSDLETLKAAAIAAAAAALSAIKTFVASKVRNDNGETLNRPPGLVYPDNALTEIYTGEEE